MDDPRFFLDGASEGDDATADPRARFLAVFREKGAVYAAARAIGVHKSTVYRWRDNDPAFAAAWDEAKGDCIELMESTFYERGRAGEFQHGHKWLMAMAPERWAERLKLERVLDEGIEAIAAKYDVSPDRLRQVAGIVGSKNGRNGNGQAKGLR